jgi:hypothetical protein
VCLECNRETSIMRGPWPARGYCAMGEKIFLLMQIFRYRTVNVIRTSECGGAGKSTSMLLLVPLLYQPYLSMKEGTTVSQHLCMNALMGL